MYNNLMNILSLFLIFIFMNTSCKKDDENKSREVSNQTKNIQSLNQEKNVKGEIIVFKSDLGFSIAYKNQPGTSIEDLGFNKAGYYEILYISGMNLAAQIRVYNPEAKDENPKKIAEQVLLKDLKAYAIAQYDAVGAPECKKTDKPPFCENNPEASALKQTTFAGQAGYQFYVVAQPMPYTMIYIDYHKKRFEIKDISGITGFKFE